MTKEKVYMVCDIVINDNFSGRILHENGSEIGRHTSSNYHWLRKDLRSKLDDESKYEIVDLVEQPVRKV